MIIFMTPKNAQCNHSFIVIMDGIPFYSVLNLYAYHNLFFMRKVQQNGLIILPFVLTLWLLFTLHARRNACTAKDLNVHVYVIDFEAQMLHAMIVIMIQKYIKYFRYQPI